MLGLPQKPWRKIKVELQGDGHYSLTFVSPVKDETEFRKIIDEDLAVCLGEDCFVVEMDWTTKSLSLKADDIEVLKGRLAKRSIAMQL